MKVRVGLPGRPKFPIGVATTIDSKAKRQLALEIITHTAIIEYTALCPQRRVIQKPFDAFTASLLQDKAWSANNSGGQSGRY